MTQFQENEILICMSCNKNFRNGDHGSQINDGIIQSYGVPVFIPNKSIGFICDRCLREILARLTKTVKVLSN